MAEPSPFQRQWPAEAPPAVRRAWPLAGYLSLLMVLASLLTASLVAGAALLHRVPRIDAEAQRQVQGDAQRFARQAALLLNNAEQRLLLLAAAVDALPPASGQALVSRPLSDEDLLDLVYMTAANGEVSALGLQTGADDNAARLLGLDLSRSPAVRAARPPGQLHWGRQQLSLFSGTTVVSLSTRLRQGGTLVAEVQLQRLLGEVNTVHLRAPAPNGTTAVEPDGLLGTHSELWVVDERGEILADTANQQAVGRLNLQGSPVLAQAHLPEASPDARLDARPVLWQHQGRQYHVSAARSPTLGWVVAARLPAGLDHPRIRSALGLSAAAIATTLVLSLLLAPWMARPMARALHRLVNATQGVAEGLSVLQWPRGPIRELNHLSDTLAWMEREINQRQAQLRQLNSDLEQRVTERTRALASSKAALQQSLEHLQRTRDDLQRNERLAALGGLVAGVAHELNTPLGNGLLAVSTLRDDTRAFRQQLAGGLRRSALEQLLQGVDDAADIAHRNLQRAADLVTSFKQVAVDQTSGQRRRFELQAVVQELLLTLQPTLSRTPYRVSADLPPGLWLDSYPGALGQILTNLINNAVLHGFDERDHGQLTLHACALPEGMLELSVSDDGRGIPPSLIGRIFDPFVTTRMGRGGTGLGLNIAHSMATNVLGGALTVRSTEGVGTTFTLRLPQVAPHVAPHVATQAPMPTAVA